MLALVALPALVLYPPQVTTGALVEPAVLKRLRSVAGEIAKTGEAALVERMRAALAGLGDDEKELEKQARAWRKTVESAKPSRSTRSAAASKLRRELETMVAQLPKEDEARRAELARWIVELDCEQAAAQEALGRTREPDGEWLDDEQSGWKTGARYVAEYLAAANAVVPEIQRGVSENPALLAVCGGGNVVRGHHIELHSAMSAESLERILRQALRAAALSNGLLFDREQIPNLEYQKYVLLTSDAQLRPALDESLAARGLTEKDRATALELDFSSFLDKRGWETVRWCSEAEASSLVLWRNRHSTLPWLVQPCLSAGHLNWVCLRFLGTSMPNIGWREDPETADGTRTTARKDETLLREARWRVARQTLWGCRSWMIDEARAGRDPPWVRAMEDEEGKVRDENLLKSTLVCELLQQEGRLLQVMKDTSDKKDPVPAFEKALGETVPEFEARWRRWLLQVRAGGMLQELERGATADEEEGPFAAALRALSQTRAAAFEGQSPEITDVVLDPDLCRAAELHARYLTLNAEQKASWPAAHEEYADEPGFTPEGALAGGRSVIAFDGDPVHSVRGWLDTFYHRLPLLAPGLFGVGFGAREEVVVLDVGSLVVQPLRDHVVVWPISDATDVPRRFTPELPNPVPGADMAELGYAVSFQLYFAVQESKSSVRLELFSGDPVPKNAVECHVISPEAPLFVDLAPENAWALIPKRALAKKARYTVRASWNGKEKVWSFTTGD